MKILLAHCTPKQVGRALLGHDVATAFQMGWNELENGELLKAAEQLGFELLIICDQNLAFQQNLSRRTIAILELWTNHRPTLELHFDFIRANAESMKHGRVSQVGEAGPLTNKRHARSANFD